MTWRALFISPYAKAKTEEAAAEAEEIPGEHTDDDEEEEKDVSDGKRVHAWVLVLAGKREVPESIFVEPTTARKFPLDASPYQAGGLMRTTIPTAIGA